MKRADEIVPTTEAEKAGLSFWTHIMRKELDALHDLWAEDAVQEIPFAPEIEDFEPVWKGRDKIMSYYRRAIPDRRDHVYWVHAVHHTTDPEVVIIEASAHSKVASTGRVYDQKYVVLFRVRNGRIVLFREYVNPLNFMRAFG